jgi:phosphoribosylanthranilate isomerase
LKSREALDAAVEGGARFVGFVFFPASPRSIAVEDAAALRARVPPEVKAVAVLVEPDEALLARVVQTVKPDILQLHGQESPEAVAAMRRRHNVLVMKALALSQRADLEPVPRYAAVADLLLFDSKPDAAATRPGGNAQRFDWQLLNGAPIGKPWMLSGGLNADNVAEAVRISGARLVDVSSGVEARPGVKDPERIRAFLKAVERL